MQRKTVDPWLQSKNRSTFGRRKKVSQWLGLLWNLFKLKVETIMLLQRISRYFFNSKSCSKFDSMTTLLSKFDFQALQRLAKAKGVALLIDEVQTGGGPTGKIWAHEHFDLPFTPDIVTFSKKMQTGGFYHADEFK
jgi:hypothetical protein